MTTYFQLIVSYRTANYFKSLDYLQLQCVISAPLMARIELKQMTVSKQVSPSSKCHPKLNAIGVVFACVARNVINCVNVEKIAFSQVAMEQK